jgi:hypothetical protein
VRIWALVQYDRSVTDFETSQANREYHIRVKFSWHDLKAKGVTPREGDYIAFGNNVFEIYTIGGPRLVVGQPLQQWDFIADCKCVRINVADITVVNVEGIDGIGTL